MSNSLEQADFVRQFNRNHWKIVDRFELESNIEFRAASIKVEECGIFRDLDTFWSSIFSQEILEIIISIINSKLEFTSGDTRRSKSIHRPTNLEEIKCFFGIKLLLENTYSVQLSVLRTHLRELKKKYTFRMDANRYAILLSSIVPSNSHLQLFIKKILSAMNSKLETSSIAVIDESLYEYYVRNEVRHRLEKENKDPVPQVYIPKKPRPNGLLNYVIAIAFRNPIKSNSIHPFIVGMYPHLIASSAPKHFDVVRYFMDNWSFEKRPHIVADSAFGSFQLLDDIKRWGSTATFALSSSTEPNLWKLLRAGLVNDKWRAAFNETSGVVASLSLKTKTGKTEQVCQTVISTGFKYSTSPIQPTSQTSLEGAVALSKIPVDTLRFIAQKCGLSISGDCFDLVERITGINVMVEEENNEQSNEQSENLNPLYSSQSLKKRKITELRSIAKVQKVNLTKAKTKDEIVNRISEYFNTNQRDWNKLVDQFHEISLNANPQPSPVNDLYGDFFNFVDLHDRRFYKVEYKHKILNWRTMMFQALWNVFIVNLWVLWNQKYPIKFIEFREMLGKILIQSDQK